MLKCKHDIVGLSVFLVMIYLRNNVGPHDVCVTASPALNALVISLFTTFCMYYTCSAYNILFTFHITAVYISLMIICCLLLITLLTNSSPKQPAEINRVTRHTATRATEWH